MHLFMIQLMVAVNLNNGWDTFDKVEYLDINQGQITSPGYPGKYTNNVKHAWEIRTRPNLTYFIFTIHDMDIPCGDYLKIEEVNPCCHTPFYKCGKMHEQKRTVYVRGKQIRISFTSDNTLNARGFNLSWTGICIILYLFSTLFFIHYL
ncbi:cubilin-like [Saccostrea cucullata]|uniref:cubilin-like n=1 Tax=Saccostrea cuccullata TaxID=36930 RepID=UPI002ED2E542